MNTALDSVIDAVPASIELNKAHFPVTVLGPGRRIGIWFQGCSIGCTGCISQDTWSPDASKSMDVPTLLAWCREVAGGALDGVTISGGEPFEHPVALAALLDGLHAWRAETSADFDILCYSGLPLRRLRAEHRPILEAEGLRRWISADLDGYASLDEACRAQGFFQHPVAQPD